MANIETDIIINVSQAEVSINKINNSLLEFKGGIKNLQESINSTFNFGKAIDSDAEKLRKYYASLQTTETGYNEITQAISKNEKELRDLITAKLQGEKVDQKLIDLQKHTISNLKAEKTQIDNLANSYEETNNFGKAIDSDAEKLRKYYASLQTTETGYNEITQAISKNEKELRDLITAKLQGEKVDQKLIDLQKHTISNLKAEKTQIDNLANSYEKTNVKQSAWQSFQSKGNGLAKEFGSSIGYQIGIMMGGMEALNFLKEGVAGYLGQQKAQALLLAGLNGNIEAQQRLIEDADRLKALYVIDDDTINSAQSFLAATGKTEAQIKLVTEAAAAFSRATGEDYASSVEMIGATLEGNKGKLGKYASELKTMTTAQLMAGDGARYFLTQFKNAGLAYGDTEAGKLEKFTIALEDLKKAFGASIGALTNTGALNGWTTMVTEIGKMIKSIFNPKDIDEFAGGILRLIGGPFTAFDLALKSFGVKGGVYDNFAKGLEVVSFGLIRASKDTNEQTEAQSNLAIAINKSAGSFVTYANEINKANQAEENLLQTNERWVAMQSKARKAVLDEVTTQVVAAAMRGDISKLKKEDIDLTKNSIKTNIDYYGIEKKIALTSQTITDALLGETKAVKGNTDAKKEALSLYEVIQKQLADEEKKRLDLAAIMILKGVGDMRDLEASDLKIEKLKAQITQIENLGKAEKALLATRDLTQSKYKILENQITSYSTQLQLLVTEKMMGNAVDETELLNIQAKIKFYNELKTSIDDYGKSTEELIKGEDVTPNKLEAFILKISGLHLKSQIPELQAQIKNTLNLWSDFYSQLLDLRQLQLQNILDLNQKELDANKASQNEQESLAKSGYANNLKALKDAEANLQAQRKQGLIEMEKINKRERALAQAAAAVEIAKAVANIFSQDTKKLGSFGVITAIAGVAAMLAAFGVSIAKGRAESKKMGKGGLLEGASHQNGGIYIPQLRTEVEGGEFVLNKRATNKWLPLIEMINKDDSRLANLNLSGDRNVNVSVNFEDSKNLAETNRILRNGQKERMWKEGNTWFYKNGITTTKITK